MNFTHIVKLTNAGIFPGLKFRQKLNFSLSQAGRNSFSRTTFSARTFDSAGFQPESEAIIMVIFDLNKEQGEKTWCCPQSV